jgi:ABC-2 type transport system ATP-binding protein
MTPPSATSTDSTGRIVCRGLKRRFGDKQALKGIDLEVGPGGITGLLGPNGSGKSTLMRCLTGLIRPDAGHAEVDGLTVRGDGADVRARLTYSPGELNLYGEMRGDEHLYWLLRGREASAHDRALEMAERFDLPLTRKVRGYSHGMKRQLCFAAAMAPDVRLRILDEITDGLDPSRRGQVLDALRKDADSGTTLLLSSHHLGEVDRACDRMVFLNEGELIADESPASVLERTSRLVHLTYAEALNEEQLARLQGPAVERIQPSGRRVSVWIRESDPREFLAAVAQLTDLQSPRRIEYGSLSLAQMYTDIYGVRGV